MFSVKYHVHKYILYFSSLSPHFLIIYIIVCVYNRRPSERIFIFDPLIHPPFTPFKIYILTCLSHDVHCVSRINTFARTKKHSNIPSYHHTIITSIIPSSLISFSLAFTRCSNKITNRYYIDESTRKNDCKYNVLHCDFGIQHCRSRNSRALRVWQWIFLSMLSEKNAARVRLYVSSIRDITNLS